jgi:hypothetical protein
MIGAMNRISSILHIRRPGRRGALASTGCACLAVAALAFTGAGSSIVSGAEGLFGASHKGGVGRVRASIVSAGDIAGLSAQLRQPIYWDGVVPGTRYELTRTANDDVYIRYLTHGAAAGDPLPAFLSVGTYPVSDALTLLRAIAHRKGEVTASLRGGGIAVASAKDLTNVYFAEPGKPYLVEVFDPYRGDALKLVISGSVKPVE